jgi:hypothetical protein
MLLLTRKLILFALFYGVIAYSVWFFLGTAAWYLYPHASYSAHTRGEKIAGWIFTIVSAIMAARVNRPNRRWVIATSIATAQVVQLLAAGIFILRFGREVYIASYVFWPTFFTTIAIGWLSGLVVSLRPFSHRNDVVSRRPTADSHGT